MSDDKPKVAIPAWQRAAPPPSQPPPAAAQDDPVSSQADATETTESTAPTPSATEPAEVVVHESSSAERAPKHSDTQNPSFQPGEFEAFKQQQVAQAPPQPQAPLQQRPIAPPIITYPEFLVEAHKPPPLVTLSNILSSIYVAGGVAAALYGASKFLVTPMLDSLTASRHDFATHSQGKLDEFNERLSKIVSKVPGSQKGATGSDSGFGDTDSETSDPTELYHRDMGTQTSPPPSRPSSPSDTGAEGGVDAFQVQGLAALRGHLEQLAKGSERVGESQKDRQESISNLKHYLDQLQYANSAINVWAGNDDVNTTPHDDAVEDLKKEIRAVKGVLLSAKRFPALSRAVPAHHER